MKRIEDMTKEELTEELKNNPDMMLRAKLCIDIMNLTDAQFEEFAAQVQAAQLKSCYELIAAARTARAAEKERAAV